MEARSLSITARLRSAGPRGVLMQTGERLMGTWADGNLRKMGSAADGRTAPYLTAGRQSGPDESRRTGWEPEVGGYCSQTHTRFITNCSLSMIIFRNIFPTFFHCYLQWEFVVVSFEVFSVAQIQNTIHYLILNILQNVEHELKYQSSLYDLM